MCFICTPMLLHTPPAGGSFHCSEYQTFLFLDLHLQCVFFTHLMLPEYRNHGMGSRMHKVTAKFNTQCLRYGNVPSPQSSILHTCIRYQFILSITKLTLKSLIQYSSKSPCSSAESAFQLTNFFIL